MDHHNVALDIDPAMIRTVPESPMDRQNLAVHTSSAKMRVVQNVPMDRQNLQVDTKRAEGSLYRTSRRSTKSYG